MCDFIMNDFEPSSAAAWKQKIQFELLGADYNESLLTKTNEGITIKPFYHIDDFEKIQVPISDGDIKICQKIIITSEEQANSKALEAIKKGANAIKFTSDSTFNFEALFKKILNKNIEFHFQLRFLSEEFTTKLIDFLKKEIIYLNLDIIGNLARTGNWHQNLNNDFKIIENLLQKNSSKFLLSVNADVYQNAGANTVQQVTYAIAHANEYLTRFNNGIASKIQFNFAIGSNYFFEISKIRAFRYLYNLILTKYNTSANPKIYTEPSNRNKTPLNSEVNTLRSNTENMSAVLGGANAITYDFNKELSKKFKNTKQITTGTYYIESITKQIADKALIIFKDIEKSGGFLAQLKEGTIQRKIKENALKEQSQFNNGTLVLLGANKHLNKQDSIKKSLNLNSFQKKKAHKTIIIPIPAKRLAEKLELKRLKDEA